MRRAACARCPSPSDSLGARGAGWRAAAGAAAAADEAWGAADPGAPAASAAAAASGGRRGASADTDPLADFVLTEGGFPPASPASPTSSSPSSSSSSSSCKPDLSPGPRRECGEGGVQPCAPPELRPLLLPPPPPPPPPPRPPPPPSALIVTLAPTLRSSERGGDCSSGVTASPPSGGRTCWRGGDAGSAPCAAICAIAAPFEPTVTFVGPSDWAAARPLPLPPRAPADRGAVSFAAPASASPRTGWARSDRSFCASAREVLATSVFLSAGGSERSAEPERSDAGGVVGGESSTSNFEASTFGEPPEPDQWILTTSRRPSPSGLLASAPSCCLVGVDAAGAGLVPGLPAPGRTIRLRGVRLLLASGRAFSASVVRTVGSGGSACRILFSWSSLPEFRADDPLALRGGRCASVLSLDDVFSSASSPCALRAGFAPPSATAAG